MITAGITNSFKEQLPLGVHDFSTDVLKIALYTADAELGPITPAYTTVEEVVGTGYTATGQILTGVTVALSESLGIAYISFNNPTWPAATFTTRGALIYNSSKANKSIAVLNFGLDQTMLSQQFQIQLPTNDAERAIIRIS
jgi:hypothetical protein